MMIQRTLIAALMAACLGFGIGCQSAPERVTLHTPKRDFGPVDWTRKERAQPVANRTLRVNRGASYHLVRLGSTSGLHVHDGSDVVMTVLSGQVRMRMGLKTLVLEPGDTVEIPRGMVRSLEHVGETEASELYAIYVPAHDGQVRRLDDGVARR